MYLPLSLGTHNAYFDRLILVRGAGPYDMFDVLFSGQH